MVVDNEFLLIEALALTDVMGMIERDGFHAKLDRYIEDCFGSFMEGFDEKEKLVLCDLLKRLGGFSYACGAFGMRLSFKEACPLSREGEDV